MKHLLKTCALLITLAMVLALVGCAKKTDGENTGDPLISVTITHVPILEEKIDVMGAGYPSAQSINDVFSISCNIVRGKLINYEEKQITYKYESGVEEYDYMSLYTLDVEQVYGEDNLVYSDNNTIKFFTYDSSYKAFPEEYAANIKVGNEYIVFLYNFEKYNKVKEWKEFAKYSVPMPNWCIVHKTVSGYESKFMQFVESENKNGNYTLSEIEKVISDYKSVLNTMTFSEMLSAQMNGQS